MLSIVAIVSKPFVLLIESGDEIVCVVGLVVEDVTGYNGIGRDTGIFVGRIVGRGGCPTSIPKGGVSVVLQHSVAKFCLHKKKRIFECYKILLKYEIND